MPQDELMVTYVGDWSSLRFKEEVRVWKTPVGWKEAEAHAGVACEVYGIGIYELAEVGVGYARIREPGSREHGVAVTQHHDVEFSRLERRR